MIFIGKILVMATKEKIKEKKVDRFFNGPTPEQLKKMSPRQRKNIEALEGARLLVQKLKKKGIIIKPTPIER